MQKEKKQNKNRQVNKIKKKKINKYINLKETTAQNS